MDVKLMFEALDQNKDGVFSYSEFECALTVLGVPVEREDLKKFIMFTDTNKDGRIDYREFFTMLYPKK